MKMGHVLMVREGVSNLLTSWDSPRQRQDETWTATPTTTVWSVVPEKAVWHSQRDSGTK